MHFKCPFLYEDDQHIGCNNAFETGSYPFLSCVFQDTCKPLIISEVVVAAAVVSVFILFEGG